MITDAAPPTDWITFREQVRQKQPRLLLRLADFPTAVLVTGCQRSGTTALTRVITSSDGMTNFQFSRDDELDAALILAGAVPHKPVGRYCFQTTYINENFHEYEQLRPHQKMIWVLRDPLSVIYSMLYNWRLYAFDELFEACGKPMLSARQRLKFRLFGGRALPYIKRAALCFNGKTHQLFELANRLPDDQLYVVDYDQLVTGKTTMLPQIFAYIGEPYRPHYADMIHTKSVDKKKQLSAAEAAVVERLCRPTFSRAQALLTH